jgi:hypothetical protein
MTKTYDEIIAEAQVVGSATEIGENTAERVGGVLEDIAKKIQEQNGEYYVKPQSGIPQTDLSEGVRNAIGNAYVKPNGGIPDSDLSEDVQSSLSKAESALQHHQDISDKATVIDLQQYVGTRVPTPEYLLSDNYMPYYTYGEYPVQMGIVVEPNEESNNDFYYVGRYTSNNGVTFGYLSFSNKGDWGFRGGNQGFFTEDNVPEALKQAIYAFGLSREKVMDAQDAAIGGKPLRTVKENGVIVYPVSHSGAIVHDLDAETTVFEEIEALKRGRKVIYVEFWDDENPPMHKDSASVGDLFYKTDTGVLYKAYEEDGVILFGIEPILEGALYIYNYGDFFGIGKIVENAGVLHLLHYQSTAETTYKGLMSAEDKRRLNTIFNYGKAQGWWQ